MPNYSNGHTTHHDCPHPECGSKRALDVTWAPRRDLRGRCGFIFGCHRCRDAGREGRDWLRQVATALGMSVGSLRMDPYRFLPPTAPVRRGIDPLPEDDDLARWRRMLWSGSHRGRRLRAELYEERGLGKQILKDVGMGYDPEGACPPLPGVPGFVLPVYCDGELVNVRWRFRYPRGAVVPEDAPKVMTLTGRTAERGGLPIYPAVPPGPHVWLAEGEWDALLGKQRRLPICGSLCSQTITPQMLAQLRPPGRRFVLAWDACTRASMEVAARELLAAGALSVRIVDLTKLGQAAYLRGEVKEVKDYDLSDFMKANRGLQGNSLKDALRPFSYRYDKED